MTEEKLPRPWEKQLDEPEESFVEFRYYRDMPQPRRVQGVLHGSTEQKWNWASQWHWVSRARQYDDHLSDLAVEERETAVREQAKAIGEDHLRLLQGMREFALRETAKWLEQARASGGTSLIKIGDLVRVVDCAVKLDRLTLGETTENVGTGHQDLSGLSVDELRQYHELAKKACGDGQ